ncbi:hypothetical protein FRC14_003928 [Serendipita sp. 396]|nr:hypothetical protein FRC14_003928 [Serendipita sp. 396]
MDGNPWGNAWAEPEKPVVQEVVVEPKEDKWVAPPPSGDISTSWTTGWGTQTETTSVWKSTKPTTESVTAPWETVETARAAYVLGGEETEPVVEEVPPRQSPEPVQEEVAAESESPIALQQILNAPSLTPPDFGSSVDLPPKDDADIIQDDVPFVPPFTTPQEEITDTWRSLSNAAITAGDEAVWEGAWNPATEQVEGEHVGNPTEQVDEWSQAIQEKGIRDARIPPEMMDMIMNRFEELSQVLWPEEDLETAREGPAPRGLWQGGLENVDGLTSLVNRHIPPPPSAPPIHFANTQIASSFHNALKMTKSYSVVQKSPLNRLLKAADSWESSRIHDARNKPFSLEAWLSKQNIMAPTKTYTDPVSPDMEGQTKTGSIKDIFSRGSIDLTPRSSSSSPAPRPSRDGLPTTRPNSTISTTATPTSSSPTVSGVAATEAPVPTSTPSAVTRFLNRFSRRTDDAPKRQPSVSLRSDELDFLDMVPTMTPGSTSSEAIRQEIEKAGGYPDAMLVGGMMGTSTTLSQRGPSVPRTRNHPVASKDLINMSSSDFDSLLDAQITEVQDEQIKRSLVEAHMMAGPGTEDGNSRYSRLNIPLFGSKPTNPGVQLLSSQSGSNTSNSLFDDDEFDTFLASPANQPSVQTAQSGLPNGRSVALPSQPPFTSSSSITSPLKPASAPPLAPRASTRATPTPSRGPVVAIMSQTSPAGSRPGTPSNVSIAPLLPPPPGGRPMFVSKPPVDLFGDTTLAPSPPRPMSNGAQMAGGAADLASLMDFAAPSKPSANPSGSLAMKPAIQPKVASTPAGTGGLSAQDLSFFEGL